jgi:hypothetical protein
MRQLSFFFMVLFLAVFLASPVAAKKKVVPKPPPRYFILDVSLGLTYDDNIIRYSDADLDLFNADVQPGKFAIGSKSDWIVTPQIHPRLQSRLLGGQPASITFGYDYYGYIKNDIRRYSRFTVSGQHYFSSKGYAQLTYGYIPKYYYRNLFYGNDPLGNDIYLPAKFSKNAIQAEVGYDITRTIKGAVRYQYLNKSYNSVFNFRNLNLNGFAVDAIWRALKPLKIWAGYNYENARAKGADLANKIPDYSYIAWDATLGVRHYLAIWPSLKPEIYSSFQYRLIDYQTTKVPGLLNTVHVYQYGRSDHNYQLHLGTGCRIPYQMRLDADYALTIKRVSLPDIYPNPYWNILQTTGELEHLLNYTANTISLKISRQF